MIKTREEFDARLKELLSKEAAEPYGWWYLSYADENGFMGGAIIEARGFTGAAYLANILKISPGGEVMGLKIPPDQVPAPVYRHRLLTKEQLSSFWGDMETLEVLEGRKRE